MDQIAARLFDARQATAGPAISSQVAQQGRGAADCCEYSEAAGTIASAVRRQLAPAPVPPVPPTAAPVATSVPVSVGWSAWITARKIMGRQVVKWPVGRPSIVAVIWIPLRLSHGKRSSAYYQQGGCERDPCCSVHVSPHLQQWLSRQRAATMTTPPLCSP